MSSVYNGVAGNIGSVANPSATIPSDGDPLAVASVDTTLQRLIDYIAFLQQNAGPSILAFAATTAVPNTASTTFDLWLSGFSTAAPTTGGSIGSRLNAPFSGRIVGWALATSQIVAGGTVTVSANVNAVNTSIRTLTAVSGTFQGTTSIPFTATSAVGVTIANGAGVTASVGTCWAALFISLI